MRSFVKAHLASALRQHRFKNSVLPTECIYAFCMIFGINNNYLRNSINQTIFVTFVHAPVVKVPAILQLKI
jgi:hypothetical protein